MAGSHIKSSGAFNPKVIFGLILVGALAFFATLYFIGTGATGSDANDGGAHASGKGLNGYAALVQTLEADGHDVSLSRNAARFDDDNLLVLTPPLFADPVEISKIINDRRYVGPTLVILPKWATYQAREDVNGDVQQGWVELLRSSVPDWAEDLESGPPLDLKAEIGSDEAALNWAGLGARGRLPDARYSYSDGAGLTPLVVNGKSQTLAGFLNDGGYYPALSEANEMYVDEFDEDLGGQWPVTFIVEPDLVNNFGFADERRAALAVSLVNLALDGEDLPIVFDLTTNGFGATQNLLTLAFTAPFLAATLCLILAMIVIAWRAFRRFGPPVAEGPSIAFGKTRLVKNSAGFIQRTKRLHLLSRPYADMIRQRIARILALRKPDDEAIDAVLARRESGAPPFSRSADALRAAKSPNEILRAAAALKAIERTLSK